jgi:hypothetical protein
MHDDGVEAAGGGPFQNRGNAVDGLALEAFERGMKTNRRFQRDVRFEDQEAFRHEMAAIRPLQALRRSKLPIPVRSERPVSSGADDRCTLETTAACQRFVTIALLQWRSARQSFFFSSSSFLNIAPVQ